jgi:preprotein translocase subunit Sss1
LKQADKYQEFLAKQRKHNRKEYKKLAKHNKV